jgi:hypothetical protein
MRTIFGGIFGVLAIASGALWLAGILGATLIPLLSPSASERAGVVGFAIASAGELGLYVFGFVADRSRRADKRTISKYGLR